MASIGYTGLQYGRIPGFSGYLIDSDGHVITASKMVWVRPRGQCPHYRIYRSRTVNDFIDKDGDVAVKIRNNDGNYRTMKVDSLRELAGK